MKHIIFVLCIVALMSNAACAQKIAADKVPASVTSAFKAKFPTAKKASWEIENKTDFEVNFKLNGEEVSANFSPNGEWIETETELEVSALPAAIQLILKNDFAGFEIEEVSKVESAKNGSIYMVEVEKGEEKFDVSFSLDGKVLSKIKLVENDEKD